MGREGVAATAKPEAPLDDGLEALHAKCGVAVDQLVLAAVVILVGTVVSPFRTSNTSIILAVAVCLMAGGRLHRLLSV